MSEKYYVVGGSELDLLRSHAFGAGMIQVELAYYSHNPKDEDLRQAEAACRARPFEKYQAVVEAAKDYIDKDDADTQHSLKDALAALEENV